jgi:outer membrane immunogenic protein
MLRTTFLTSVIMFGLSQGALGADAVTAPPEAPPVAAAVSGFGWSGFYLGATGGYDWQKGHLTDGVDSFGFKLNDGRFGGFAGYNFDIGSGAIAGVEGDLGYDWGKYSEADAVARTGFNGSARARVGFAFDRALIYAAGGYTASRFKIENAPENWSKTLSGWTVGAGVDYAFTNTVFGRLEYRYNDFGKTSVDDTGVDLKLKQNIVQVGLGVKF